MNNRTLRVLVTAALVIAAAAAIGIGAYNAGVAQGIAESGRALAVPPEGTPYIYAYPRPWHGFGFFPFFPFLFVFFLFFVLRGLWWGGRGGYWRGGKHWEHGGVPPAFDEWHRRAHAQQTPPPSGPTTA
jgi:hypothetical protein